MKCFKLMAVILALLLLTMPCAAAFDGEEETDGLYHYLPEDEAAVVQEAKTGTGYDLNRGISGLIEKMYAEMGGILKKGLSSAACLLAVSLLCSLAALWIGDKSSFGAYTVNSAAVGTVLVVGARELGSALGQATELLNELNVFSKALLPAMTAAGAAAGGGGAAIAKQGAALLFADVLITLFVQVFIPMTYVTLALRAVGILSQNTFFTRFSAFIKNTASLVIRTLLTLYLAYISVMGLVGSAADTLAKKAAKTAVSAGIPVVGGVLTEAAESIYAGSAMIKNTLGVFGVLAILSCALLPLLSTGVSYLALRAAAALAQSAQEHGGREAIDAVADAVSIVFAMCAGAVALLLLTVIICMKTAV